MSLSSNNWNVIIIGAGASGLFCAIECGKRGRSVLVLDHAERPGSKVLISGGGRSNFTNLNVTAEHYLSRNPHFCKSALARFTPRDIVALAEKHGIKYYEKEAGQIFCVRSSREILAMLEKECQTAGAELALKCSVTDIKKEEGFVITTNQGEFRSDSLIIATGGLSYSNLGASGFGHDVARRFGLRIIQPRPALVPFVFQAKEQKVFADLAGIPLDACVSCRGQRKVEMRNLLSGYFPKRFSQAWCDHMLRSEPINQYSDRGLKEIAHALLAWEVVPKGTEGYKTAEATAGGVDTDELSSKTMEAKKVPGLYFIGEVMDVTGELGGYNLHWAWASGHAAGQHA